MSNILNAVAKRVQAKTTTVAAPAKTPAVFTTEKSKQHTLIVKAAKALGPVLEAIASGEAKGTIGAVSSVSSSDSNDFDNLFAFTPQGKDPITSCEIAWVLQRRVTAELFTLEANKKTLAAVRKALPFKVYAIQVFVPIRMMDGTVKLTLIVNPQ